MQLVPYIFFYGRAEEALEFYKSVLGGTYEAMRSGDAPEEISREINPEHKQKIMNASFTAPGISFMCSDGRPDDDAKRIDPDEGNISLALSVTDGAEGNRLFAALSQGGSVRVPLDDAFWGGRFGIIHDRFGIEWMVTAP
ncbi:MAG TPA: VOC family protein [Candidatus Tyrphobacter sp.]